MSAAKRLERKVLKLGSHVLIQLMEAVGRELEDVIRKFQEQIASQLPGINSALEQEKLQANERMRLAKTGPGSPTAGESDGDGDSGGD